MKRPIFLILVLSALLLMQSSAAGAAVKYVGGDISLLPSYESNGAVYYDTDGTTQITDLLSYFKNLGHNAMRVRLFVEPDNADSEAKGEGVVQDLDYVKSLGKRIKDAGFAFLLDFHYSDTWADPAKQYTPADWASLSDDALYTKIYDYTKETLQSLIDAGATPDFIQIGNEISYGMLWGVKNGTLKKCYTSSTDNWSRFTTLLSKASAACREVCPDAKIIVHTERVAQTDVLKAFYDNMKSYGVDYDIIGLSYYPVWHGDLKQLSTALNTLENNFSDKDIWIVETGYYYQYQPNDAYYDLSATYPVNGDGQCAFTEALIDTLNNHSSVKGLFWWHMEANEYGLDWATKRVTDKWWDESLFDNNNGKALKAIKVLKNFLSTGSGIGRLTNAENASAETSTMLYSLSGQCIGRETNRPRHGIYVSRGKKIMAE